MGAQVTTIGPGSLTIGDPDDALAPAFSSQCRSCTLRTSVDTGDSIDLLSGETVDGERSESFTLAGSFQQDFGKDRSVVEWLFLHRGQTVPFEYVPNVTDGRNITGQVKVEAVDIGGDVKAKPASDFEFALKGAPTIGDATPE